MEVERKRGGDGGEREKGGVWGVVYGIKGVRKVGKEVGYLSWEVFWCMS